ncbi:MAG: SIS domain-containing protein, partial [Nitrososphaerota archaeon]
FNEAIKRRIRLLAMTSGGSLAEIANRNNIQLIELSKGFPPRMSLPEMVGAAISTLDNTDITKNASETLLQAVDMLTEIAEKNGPSSPYQNNTAKKAALHFYNGFPSVFCSGHLYFTGLRLKNQLNENAKYPCVVHEIPESMHNTLEALPYSDMDKYLLLRSSSEPKDVSAQMRFISSSFSHKVMEVWFKGNEVYESIASIMWADYVSTYLAALREVDPITVARIAALRKEVEKSLKNT